MSKMLCVSARIITPLLDLEVVLGIQVEKFREKLHSGFRTDIQGFHEGYRKRSKELEQNISTLFRDTARNTHFHIKSTPNSELTSYENGGSSNEVRVCSELRWCRKGPVSSK